MATVYERPGVYSDYGASSVISGGGSGKTVGLAAKAKAEESGKIYTLTGYAQTVSIFGEGTSLSEMARVLFLNGATKLIAAAVNESGSTEDYAGAFSLLEKEEDISVVVCDGCDSETLLALKESVAMASGSRKERIGVCGQSAASVESLVNTAGLLNSERMVLVGPDCIGTDGAAVLGGHMLAAAVAGVIASQTDPALPLNGAELKGFGGITEKYGDNEINSLVRGGVTPIESVGGSLSIVRGITTRTKTSGAPDTTWRELTTTLIIDDVIPSLRNSLRSKFSRAKNNAQSRGAIRSQVILELENKVDREIIDSYSDVGVSADSTDPTICNVDFNFSVAHGLNQIYLSAHISI